MDDRFNFFFLFLFNGLGHGELFYSRYSFTWFSIWFLSISQPIKFSNLIQFSQSTNCFNLIRWKGIHIQIFLIALGCRDRLSRIINFQRLIDYSIDLILSRLEQYSSKKHHMIHMRRVELLRFVGYSPRLTQFPDSNMHLSK